MGDDDLTDLEQLLNDLGRPKSVAPAKKVRSSVVNINELEMLMNDLADSPAPKKPGQSVIRQQPAQVHKQAPPVKAAAQHPSISFDGSDDLDSIMNSLNGESDYKEPPRKHAPPPVQPEQPPPVRVLPQKSPAPVVQPLPSSSQRMSTMNDLEALLNDLDDPRTSVRAPQAHTNYSQAPLSSHSNNYHAPPTNHQQHSAPLSSVSHHAPASHSPNNYQPLSPLSQNHSSRPGVGPGMGAQVKPAQPSFIANQPNSHAHSNPHAHANLNGHSNHAYSNHSQPNHAHAAPSQPKAFVPKPASSRPLNDTAIDDMLVDLQKQLMATPDPSSPATNGTCSTCGKVILGEVITALGNRYHPEHFVCGNCQYPLGTSNFYEQDGIPHCEKCYQELLCARCAHCDEPILDRCVTALGKKWHLDHFCCVQCQRGFKNGSFFERDGRPFCENCFNDAFAPKCGGCGQSVIGPTINALGQTWHPEHFVCQYCQKAFTGSFFDFGGKPYCDVHYHQQTGSLCAGCNKAVAGQCIDALGKKWHPEHFVCAFCMEQLMAGSFTENQNKAYCKSCHGKLFG